MPTLKWQRYLKFSDKDFKEALIKVFSEQLQICLKQMKSIKSYERNRKCQQSKRRHKETNRNVRLKCRVI